MKTRQGSFTNRIIIRWVELNHDSGEASQPWYPVFSFFSDLIITDSIPVHIKRYKYDFFWHHQVNLNFCIFHFVNYERHLSWAYTWALEWRLNSHPCCFPLAVFHWQATIMGPVSISPLLLLHYWVLITRPHLHPLRKYMCVCVCLYIIYFFSPYRTTVLIRVACSSWPFTSPQITLSNRQRSVSFSRAFSRHCVVFTMPVRGNALHIYHIQMSCFTAITHEQDVHLTVRESMRASHSFSHWLWWIVRL